MQFAKSLLLAAAGTALAAAPVLAQSFTPWQTKTVGTQPTNFFESLLFQKFDPALGTLQAVQFKLAGGVEGSFGYESLDAAPSTITATLGATIKLQRPNNTDIVVVLPVLNQTFSTAARDGNVDFGGPSGGTVFLPYTSAAASGALNALADLGLFTGPGTITLPIAALGNSSATGPGNLITLWNTSAGATAELRYQYAASVVPEPSTYALMGTGLVALFGIARRRRSA